MDTPPPEPADERTPVLVSACLLGRACRYDGRHNADTVLRRALTEREERPVPFCPEEHGGLGTPRPPAWLEEPASEIADGTARVVTEGGLDVTAGFRAGARGALETCRGHGIRKAYLKERSPSCGVHWTHVAGACVEGPGLTSEVLSRAGIETLGIEGRKAEKLE